MKKLSIILFLATGMLTVQGQPSQKGEYSENNTMSAFHGEWRWVDGIDTVQIYLSTRKVNDEDRLVGWHFYKKGNVTVESSWSSLYDPAASSIDAVYMSNQKSVRWVRGSMKDLTISVRCGIRLALNKSKNTLTLKREHTKGCFVGVPENYLHKGFTLPGKITLTKMIAD